MIFLICPVRNARGPEVGEYVEALERAGERVHWPTRDTPQDGDGFAICLANLDAMRAADEVRVWWSQGSEGSLFDLGMAFALCKRVTIANEVHATEHKSFANVLRALAGVRGGEGDAE